MGKIILVIRKQDKTVHRAQVHQKAFLTSYNNKLPASQKFTIEEMDEDDAKDLPFIDKSYVTAGEATKKLSAATRQLEAKDQEILDLKNRLEQLQNGGNKDLVVAPPAPGAAADENAGNKASESSEAGKALVNEAGMSSVNTTAQAIPVNYERLSNPKLMEELTKRQIAYDPAMIKKDLVKLLTDDDKAKKAKL